MTNNKKNINEALTTIWPEYMNAQTKSGLRWGDLIAEVAARAVSGGQ